MDTLFMLQVTVWYVCGYQRIDVTIFCFPNCIGFQITDVNWEGISHRKAEIEYIFGAFCDKYFDWSIYIADGLY